MGTRAMRVWMRLLVTAAVALAAATSVVAPAVADDGQPGSDIGVGIWVPVLPTHAKTPPPAASGGAGAGAAASAPSSVITQTQNTPGPGDMVIAGGLYLSDVNAASRPTLNPLEGRTELWFTVRNLSTDTVDATSDFSLATFYGERIDGARVDVSALRPGETRVVGTTLQGSGQWPFVIGRVTLDPPDTIGGQKTAPVSRATVVYVFPWLLAIVAVLLALAVVLRKLSASVLGATTVPAASNA
ncbi:hypothetical protein [Microbacterium sp. SORGH_AS_0888]|uniref:hypothetical protein n=1 Tax=Microbacterium sp. SORGH_AS_0888 TaxID=3041791 RepID=UPI0027816274|nr:hypothetical protein [Microbacterium sp. SORGH_AS_0888]MDQ1129036.1 opacity protein-like surface antigen [Microbacterium sp. SORGH_AS_0888]